MELWRVKHAAARTLTRYAPALLGLRRLGLVHGTRKMTLSSYDPGVDYASVYERYLRPLRRRRFTLLELGVYRGESLRMWASYFPRAQIVGLDIDPDSVRRAPGFDVVVASQDDPAALDGILTRHPDLRVVVDDGSHLNHLTIASFRHLFPKLPSGGVYAIEDLDTSYGSEGYANERADILALLDELSRDCDLGGADRLIAFVHLWPRMLVVGRA